ncbi:MAG: glucosaminidase domain-containing protein [Prevotellaceae bacterium]|jgi:flagellar protein FlgJ|nr:glucosaminidase domain-containing protein [Prevotellaceae bacterium]
MKASDFVKAFATGAVEAYNEYGIYPSAILCQAALESAWATSAIYLKTNNLFGVTKGGGASNEWWDGTTYLSTSGLTFRKYSSARNSIMDFARIIKTNYPSAASVSSDINAYAYAISNSSYISESNGDNRSGYEKGLKSIYSTLKSYIENIDLKKK